MEISLIWRVLASSDRISSSSPLKAQHSNPNPNPNPLANQLWYIDCFTPPTPLIIPHIPPAFFEFLMALKNWCPIHARWLKHSIRFCGIFFSCLKQNFLAYRSFSRPDCIFEIHQLWQSGFCRVYSNYCCSCLFKSEIIKISQSSHKMYSNNILNFQDTTIILNACTKKSGNLLKAPRIIFVGYLMPNPYHTNNQFYFKQFSLTSVQLQCQKLFYFK